MAGVGKVLSRAVDLLERGRPREAEALCRRLLKANPALADAWHIAGVAAAQTGRMAEARGCFVQAVGLAPGKVEFRLKHVLALCALSQSVTTALRHVVALEPDHATAWTMLAEATVREKGQTPAIRIWQALAGLRPGVAVARFNLGVALQESGRLAEAVAAYRDAAEIEPTLADAHFNRGNALRDLGWPEAAGRAYRACLSANPAAVGAARNLGLLLLPSDPPAAVSAFRRACLLDPDDLAPRGGLAEGGGCLDLAAALVAAERPSEALLVLDRVLARLPLSATGHNHRATALGMLGHWEGAELAQTRGLVCDPAVPEAWTTRAQSLLRQGRPGNAAAAIGRALRLRPAYPAGLGVLAQIRRDSGHPEEAAAIMRRALAVNPQPTRSLHSDYLLMRQSEPDADAAALLRDHRHWAVLHAPASRLRADPSPTDADTSRRVLRIGYLSADFRSHPVATFFQPLLAAHDRAAVHTVCYSAAHHSDSTTARLRALAGSWRDVAGLGNAALAELMRMDRIDVLVDLGGHTGDNRLDLLATAPVRVRLAAIGYPGTTGLAIEGRFSDPVIEPPGAEHWSSEPVIRLPGGFLCFHPPAGEIDPARHWTGRKALTFGSFNALGKLTEEVVRSWAAILSDNPEARLLLKSRALGDAGVASDLRSRFASRGLAGDRLDLIGWTSAPADHLALYRQVDIGLDPFPYNGTTTTCEAMWMGVPVVTLAGNRHAGRVGAALLTRVGLPQLVASDLAGYRRIAANLAADARWRSELRFALRARMRGGPLGDAAGLAAAIETACRELLTRE